MVNYFRNDYIISFLNSIDTKENRLYGFMSFVAVAPLISMVLINYIVKIPEDTKKKTSNLIYAKPMFKKTNAVSNLNNSNSISKYEDNKKMIYQSMSKKSDIYKSKPSLKKIIQTNNKKVSIETIISETKKEYPKSNLEERFNEVKQKYLR